MLLQVAFVLCAAAVSVVDAVVEGGWVGTTYNGLKDTDFTTVTGAAISGSSGSAEVSVDSICKEGLGAGTLPPLVVVVLMLMLMVVVVVMVVVALALVLVLLLWLLLLRPLPLPLPPADDRPRVL